MGENDFVFFGRAVPEKEEKLLPGSLGGFLKLDGATSQVKSDFLLLQNIFHFGIDKIDNLIAFAAGIDQTGTP